jgi:hypothetical protein
MVLFQNEKYQKIIKNCSTRQKDKSKYEIEFGFRSPKSTENSNQNLNILIISNPNQNIFAKEAEDPSPEIFTFRIYEIYKGKYWFHFNKFEKFFCLKHVFYR